MRDSYRSEYVGFTVNEVTRDYTFRVTKPGTEARNFTVAISNEAFLTRLVSYQDAPGVSFWKLQQALAECAELAKARLTVSKTELEEYRVAHSPPPSKPPPRYPVPTVTAEPREEPERPGGAGAF